MSSRFPHLAHRLPWRPLNPSLTPLVCPANRTPSTWKLSYLLLSPLPTLPGLPILPQNIPQTSCLPPNPSARLGSDSSSLPRPSSPSKGSQETISQNPSVTPPHLELPKMIFKALPCGVLPHSQARSPSTPLPHTAIPHPSYNGHGL